MTGPRMTPEQLANIQARANAATEGPWRVEHDNADDYEAGINYGDYPNALVGPKNESLTAEQLERPFWREYKNRVSEVSEMGDCDAEFIANARTDVPALLALVREQQAAIERVKNIARQIEVSAEPYGVEQFHAVGKVSARVVAERLRAALTATEGAK